MIGREAIVTLETLARRQARIYPDACDYGIWETPAIAAAIKAALAELKDLEGGVARKWATGASYQTRLAIEEDGGQIAGYTVRVSRCQYRHGSNTFFYCIEMNRAYWQENTKIGAEREVFIVSAPQSAGCYAN